MEQKLFKNKLPFQLLTAIEAGAEKSIEGWAKEFKCSSSDIQGALVKLRKHGHLLHPIGSLPIAGGGGRVVNVMDKQDDLVETMERQRKVYLDPQLIAFSRFVEQGIARFPALLPVFRKYLNSEMAHLTVIEEELKLPHGNRQRQVKQAKA